MFALSKLRRKQITAKPGLRSIADACKHSLAVHAQAQRHIFKMVSAPPPRLSLSAPGSPTTTIFLPRAACLSHASLQLRALCPLAWHARTDSRCSACRAFRTSQRYSCPTTDSLFPPCPEPFVRRRVPTAYRPPISRPSSVQVLGTRPLSLFDRVVQ